MTIEERNEKIVELARQGMSYTKIGQQFGLSYSYVSVICRGKLPPKYRFLTNKQVKGIIEDYQQGMKLTLICMKYGISSTNTIYRLLIQHGVTVRRFKRTRKEINEIVG